MKTIAVAGHLLASLLVFAALSGPVRATDADVAVPRHRPAAPEERAEPRAPATSTDGDEAGEAAPEFDSAALRAACEAQLGSAGVRFNWIGRAEEETCSFDEAVEILAVEKPGGEIVFPRKPVLDCGFATLLGRWTRNIAQPVLSGIAGSDLAALDTGPGFVCRNRYGGQSTKVSEHALGNAIDITAFRLTDGSTLQIGSELDARRSRALHAMRMSACGYFTTVLGPGANEAHASHFHFDRGKHGKTYNYRICE